MSADSPAIPLETRDSDAAAGTNQQPAKPSESPPSATSISKTPSFGHRILAWIYKDLSASAILMIIFTTIALVYAIESKVEAALANQLARMEACRTHPVGFHIQFSSIYCLYMIGPTN
jgi:hypothetical protein